MSLICYGVYSSASSSYPGKESGYLYDGEDSAPVMEFYDSDGPDPDHPNFLYDSHQGPRVVEFYAPWCPHCQAFRSHYVQFAHQLTTLSHGQIQVHAVSCVKHRKVCQDFKILAYPAIRLFAAGSVNATESYTYMNLHPFGVMTKLGVHVDDLSASYSNSDALPDGNLERKDTSPRFKGKASATESTDVSPSTTAITRSREDIYRDAYLSLHFALQQGVFMTPDPLNNATATALHDWIELLHKALPPTWKIHALLQAVLDNFANVTQSEQALMHVVDQYRPPHTTWSQGCSYTCGLWELFHIMAVGVMEWNMMIIGPVPKTAYLPIDRAADTLRDFIQYFFACEHCRVNFMNAYDACSLDRCHRLHAPATTREEWMQLPLWLFETHNAVNLRLLQEAAAREGRTPTHAEQRQSQWPLASDCPMCWRVDDSWDEEVVYKYMRLSYW
jgi:thiol-disulfide isomerase/thioredoxin